MRAPTFAISLLAIAALLAGCGGGDSSSASSNATNASALTEIGNVRAALAQARKTFDGGDYATAATQVGDAYLNHYENVEPPLSKIDNTLMLKIEKEIRETLRGEVKAGTPKPEVHALFDTISADLQAAEGKLK